MKTYAEQITAYDARRASAVAAMKSIMDKSAEAGETLDADEQEEYDGHEKDIEAIDGQLKRLKSLDKLNAATAKPVNGAGEDDASRSRTVGTTQVTVKGDNLPKGIRYVRFLGAKYLASQQFRPAADIAKEMWPDTPEVELALRSAVAAGTTSDTTNAGPLVVQQNIASEFAQLLVPATIIGRIPGLRAVPFNIKVPRATQNPTGYWVGEGKVKPLSAMAFDSVTLGIAKVAGIVPITEELLRFSSPAAEGIILDGLRDALAYRTDRDFLDPSKASDDVSPASITNGVTAITPTGTTADAFRDDLGSMLANYMADNQAVGGLVLVTTSTMAMRLSLMRNTLGNKEFPDISINGGFLEGIPVITSENIAAPTGSPFDGTLIVAINASEVMLADEGGVSIDISREASLQMDSAPDSPEAASTISVSLWQHNMVAFKAERFINWTKRRSAAVQYINGANYK
jgi:HK97 family phage major capsid protein